MYNPNNWATGLFTIFSILLGLVIWTAIKHRSRRWWYNVGQLIKESLIAFGFSLIIMAVLSAITYAIGAFVNFVWGLLS